MVDDKKSDEREEEGSSKSEDGTSGKSTLRKEGLQ